MSMEDIDESEHEDEFAHILEYWRDPPEEPDPVIIEGVAGFVKYRDIPEILNGALNDEFNQFDMSCLGNYLLGHTPPYNDPSHVNQKDDSEINRLSLAYERLTMIPKVIVEEYGPHVKILDISNNEFKNLDFLEHFTELTSLICDRNPISSDTNIPWMPKLELLWLNHCKIAEFYWVETLKYNCPNLRYLSLMGNPVAPSFLNGGNIYEYLQYRLYLISILTNLVHLDDKIITDDERIQAKEIYPSPFVMKIFRKTKSQLPYYLRKMSGRVTGLLSPGSSTHRLQTQKNHII